MFNIEDGELEMLALGQLSARRERELFLLLEQNETLFQEFETIQGVLENLAIENAVKSPAGSGLKAHEQLFKPDQNLPRIVPFYKTAFFRLSASILFFGSILANIYLLRNSENNNRANSVAVSKEPSRQETFLAALPMETEEFEEMFKFLHASLEKNPCDMKFTVTREFLRRKRLDEQTVIAFLAKEGGRCDCEVLMNVSMQFPQKPYKHGTQPNRTHREADIKLALQSNERKHLNTGNNMTMLALRR